MFWRVSIILSQTYLKFSYSTKITWVLLHKKCTNFVYAKVSDISKTEKVDSEEMTSIVNLIFNFKQRAISASYCIPDTFLVIKKYIIPNRFFKLQLKLFWALFDCCVDDIVNYEFARKSLNFGLLQLQNSSTMHYIPAPIE